MTPLRKRMLQDMSVRNLSVRTQRTYISLVARFAQYFKKSPEQLGPEQICDYLVYLVEVKKVSWSLYNQSVCALRFLYRVTLGKEWSIDYIPHCKGERHLPVVLSLDKPVALTSVQKACRSAASEAGIGKAVTVRSLRHSFAI